MRPWTRGCLAIVLCASRALAGGAESERADARAVYDQGTAAFDRGDFEAAARAYAKADEIVPSPTALRAAIDAAAQAGDAVLAMTLVARASSRAPDAALGASVDRARRTFAGATGTIVTSCTSCGLVVDRARVEPALPSIVRAGAHDVRLEQNGDAVQRRVVVPPDARVKIALEPAHRPTPLWLALGLGATVAGGAVTTIFAVDTLHQHDQFVASGCPHTPSCADAARAGLDAQTRTNVALGVTIGLSVLTLVALWFFTRTHAPSLISAVLP